MVTSSTPAAKKAAAAPATAKAAEDEAKRVAEEEKQRKEAEKQREKDAKATEGEHDTTDDPDTAVDVQGDVVALETGGAIAQPVGPVPTTYVDHLGVNRIAGGFDDGWVPAPVDPDPALVRQNEAAMERIKKAQHEADERQGLLGAKAERPKSADEKANEENAKKAKH